MLVFHGEELLQPTPKLEDNPLLAVFGSYPHYLKVFSLRMHRVTVIMDMINEKVCEQRNSYIHFLHCYSNYVRTLILDSGLERKRY
jgi:hypothetical protein